MIDKEEVALLIRDLRGIEHWSYGRLCEEAAETIEALVSLRVVVEAWLAEVQGADDGICGSHDFFVRVGARWSYGGYGNLMMEALQHG